MLASRLAVGKEHVISSKIFVGNIKFETTKEELVQLLSAVGPVRDAYLPTDRATGRPRGFAFVEYSTPEEAAEAIEKFNNYEFGGRRLRVNAAEDRPRPRTPRPPSPPRFSSDFGGDMGGGGGGHNEWSRPAKPKGSRRGLRGKKRSL